MTKENAIERLDEMQSQIIHGKRTFGDIADVIRRQVTVADAAGELYQAACTLMRNQDDKNCWHNLQNAAGRFDAARQHAHNAGLTKST